MKKNLKLISFMMVLCTVSVLNVKAVLSTEHSSDLLMTSLAAIGEGNPSEGGESDTGGSGESSESGENDSWWDRKDYNCKKVICDCILYKYQSEVAERVENGKGTEAHAWNCTSCGDCGFL